MSYTTEPAGSRDRIAVATDHNGHELTALFSGPDAEARAAVYADWMNDGVQELNR